MTKRFEFLTTCLAKHTKHIIVEADDVDAAAAKVAANDILMHGADQVEMEYDTFEIELVHVETEDPDPVAEFWCAA